MSRHRFVRNLDLEDELNDEEEEEDSGMSAEEKAQMAKALPIARAQLKDLKPPISDDAIADSLWHYWFDVEKSVTWLRQDWQKKGEAPPPFILPTPDQKPRKRRRHTPPPADDAVQLPLTALQRLTLARKASPSPSPAPAPSASPAAASPGNGEKPMSKLALLAQKRREAALTGEAGAGSPSRASPVVKPASPAGGQSPVAESAGGKPLSKLAQKMAAARVAREEAAAAAAAQQAKEAGSAPSDAMDEDDSPIPTAPDPLSSLFASAPTKRPTSSFFSILTSSASSTLAITEHPRPPEPVSANLHAPLAMDVNALVKRFGKVFTESPDEVVLKKRQGRAGTAEMDASVKKQAKGTAKAKALQTAKSASLPGKPRTPAVPAKSKLQPQSQPNSPSTSSKTTSTSASGSNTPKPSADRSGLTVAQQDLAGLHLDDEVDEAEREREKEKYKEREALSMKQEELIAKVKKDEEESGKRNISLIVVGHVDAGKSTLMGRVLYDIGELSEKEKTANERGSKKVGKGSFALAWGLDALGDERDRGVTIDIATTHFTTPHRNFTLLDAPGHRDFIPAMISGAAQADVALLVVDGSPGEFEAGFERGGQTREHAWLVRSLGVKEIIVAVNKMDMVSWSPGRYEEIVESLKPFLLSAGFSSSKTTFLPLAAMEGINVIENDCAELKDWYSGPTLIDALDKVEVPTRPYESPLRIPVSNVFKGQTAVASGVAVSGRLCSGVVQVGDRVRAVPGDEVANIRTIEVDDDSAPYAVAGQNVTLYLSGIDSINLAIGTVLCPTHKPVPLVTKFSAQILVFDLQSPIISGTAVELFHHSMNLPATISRLVAVMEKGQVVKERPRVLQKGMTAMVELSLRPNASSAKVPSIPLETAADNKEMGRVLIRRNGETIAAGMVMEILG
ncbi:hypothetical protein IAT38_000606 [Cryptococcus sp. DSM 104549]